MQSISGKPSNLDEPELLQETSLKNKTENFPNDQNISEEKEESLESSDINNKMDGLMIKVSNEDGQNQGQETVKTVKSLNDTKMKERANVANAQNNARFNTSTHTITGMTMDDFTGFYSKYQERRERRFKK